MKTQYYSLLLVICGAFYSFFYAGESSGGGQKGDADKGAPSTTIVESGTGAASDIAEESAYPKDLCEQFAECEASRPVRLRDDVSAPRLIVATVPDPSTTHLRVEFDRAVDGIKDAAADEQYLFRRYWFPWPIEQATLSDRASQESEAKRREFKRRLPGFLLFDRERKGEHDSLIVLLVGESPADGLHRLQLDWAIKLKREIEGLRQTPEARLHILGTSFSGSLYTLRLALQKNSVADFEAVSGTVSDEISIADFNKGLAGPRLRTLTHGSTTSLTAFKNYLKNNWHYNDRVAILSESDTVFGDLKGVRKDDFFLIPFPRDIAHLRNAYQSYPGLSGFGPMSPESQQRKNLPLPLDDTRNTINSIPDYAPQTVVSQETMASQIANRLRHEHLGFAGVIGSDILDVLFVSRYLRAASPDTRLFLLDPDLLFVHAADELPFEGVLAITTYPLLDGNPPFQPNHEAEGESHWIFPTPFQQGIHNAMRVLIADMNQKEVKAAALPGYDIVQAGDSEPALWITSVGRESFVPVAVMGMPRETPKVKEALVAMPGDTKPLAAGQAKPLENKLHEPTRIWSGLFLMVTFVLAGLAMAFDRAQRTRAEWVSDLRIHPGSGDQRQLALVLLFTIGIYLVVASPVLGQAGHYPRLLFYTVIGLFFSFVGLALPWRGRFERDRTSVLIVSLSAAAVVVVVAAFIFLSHRSDYLSGVFFGFRSFEVSAGASPAVPFLFLLGGFLVHSFSNLQRNIFHHQRQQLMPRAECDPVLRNVSDAAAVLDLQVYTPFRYSPRFCTLLGSAAFLLCFAGLYASGIRSFEGPWYDWLFMTWASALAAALVVTCAHFVRSWQLLTRILDQLETHPLRRALTALPAGHGWPSIWQSNPRKRSYLIATRSIEDLAALRDTGLCPAELDELILLAEERVGVILRKVSKGERETPIEHWDAETGLAETADYLVKELQPVWRQGGSEILDENKDAQNKHADEAPPLVYAFEFVAMRYLAFIRYVMLQLRNMMTFLTLGFLAFGFALMSYPFQGERLLAWVTTVLFLVLTSGVLVVFAQMEMDATLSRIANRDAGKLGLGFFHRAVAFGALPLLTVLASNFNGVARLPFSWIEPALKTLH